jgi:two-component system phosphate regulon response regulator PhoB
LIPDRATPLVLVADDEEELLNLACIQLETAGYETVKAYNGEEALKIVREQQPDICVFDVVMPQRNGHEVLDEMRKEAPTADTPVILISASLSSRALARVGPFPDAFVHKTNISDLTDQVQTLLSARGSAQAAA